MARILSRSNYPLALVLALVAGQAFAQSQNADTVRGLNNRVLQFHAQIQKANAAEAAAIRLQASPVFAQRNAALETLIRQSPGTALGLAFSADLRADLANKFPGAAASLEQHGQWQGTSDHVILDDPDRRTSKYEVRLRSGQETIDLYSANGEPHCVSGNIVTAKGIRVNNVLGADNVTYTAAATVAGAGCTTSGAQNTVVILAQFPGIALPSTVTPTGVSNIFFGATGRTVNTYWQEASQNRASASGTVVGPFTLDRVYSCDEYNLMRTAAIAAADSAVNFTNYTRVFIVFPNPGSCAWAGLGTLGCGTLSSADGSFQASTSWLLASYMGDANNGVKLATHEGGHNLSLHHASSRAFAAEALGAVGTAGTLNEYGDPFSTMGTWNFGHYGVPHKSAIGWLTGGQVVTTETAGSYSVLPVETLAAGTLALKVRRGTGNDAWLWVEFRQPTGLFHNSWSSTSQLFSGALVHYQDSTTGTRTHLLDFTPASTGGFNDAALTGTWVDPYSNVSLSVAGVSSSALSLNVNYGALPCTRVAPTVTLTPPNPSVQAGAATFYTLSVKNNDSIGCTNSAFALGSTLPAGWTTVFSPATLAAAPGQTLTSSMSKTVPAGFTPGTYPVDANAADANHPAVTAAANLTVTAPPEPIQVTLTANPLTVNARSNVTLTATVTKTTGPVSGAAVTFSVTRSGAGTTTATATTNASGVATYSYRAQQRGTYNATASGSFAGATATSSTVTITARKRRPGAFSGRRPSRTEPVIDELREPNFRVAKINRSKSTWT